MGPASLPGSVLIFEPGRPTVREGIGENPIGLVFPFHSHVGRRNTINSAAMEVSPEFRHRRQSDDSTFQSARILSKSEHSARFSAQMISAEGRIIRRAMIDKGRLNDKQVAFRIVGSDLIHIGVVKSVENDGFWIDSPQFIEQMQADRYWGPTVAQIGTPVFFVPTSSLMFLIATQE